ncbi:5-oxoprolinase subunit B family protein [Aeromicrobium wangtongii]|uniref:Allophanate hydrolase subunit 1 n=1 Tax=Aeromicrobium wangtongii TaxID=2969247 RepID=A0ABY5M5M5_9ACTN|nr:allophanate hydrolase subunit 1 [Aeromicrobium wangtongii]MCD9198843.1 allophanate hydrolase subunit 1 [Aeromicrobium wangtongii]UUP13117.1 allophanate hydrolase subunit 1 [Aeromicrobium wangtongii]
MRILPCGDRAVLIDCASLDEAQGWFAALENRAEVVLGARTVLVRGEPAEARALIGGTRPGPSAADSGATVEIPVTYDGDDLADVASLTGLTPDEVVAAHTGTPWTVAFTGFAPGFSYLVGGDPRLNVPRRSSPRSSVPPGAVGLAGEFSGVYPRRSPGGWQLIGRTSLAMWDSARDRPALLVAGCTVRFVVA